jgi:DHA2 family multidrug resistance protein-like MFS transporter
MKRHRLLLVLSASFSCIALDNSKLVAALPALARVGDVTPSLQHWTVEVGLLVYASLLLLGGSLSERFGPRRMLLLGLCGFGCASLAGALAGSGYPLLAARACSGAATACITPATLAALKHAFTDRERPTAIAVWTASFGVGMAIGPLLAGLLVTHGGLRLVLLANLPPLALCTWGSLVLVPADLPRRDLPLDFRGASLCLVAAACCLFAILNGPSHTWHSLEVLGSAVVGAGSLALARCWLRRARHPLFELSLFAEAGFSSALLVIFLGYFAFSGGSFVVAQYLQLARAKAAFQAGLMSLPLAGSLLLGTLVAPRLQLRCGAQRSLLFSLCTACSGLSLLAYASGGRSDLLLCVALLPFGAGSGSTFATATELSLGAVTPERAAIAAALSESAFEFGGVLGIAVLSTLLGSASFTQISVSALAPRALWSAASSLLLALLVAIRWCRPAAARTTPSVCSDP